MSSSLINTSNGSPTSACDDSDDEHCNRSSSIHSASIGEIYDIPMVDIHRPILSILSEEKVLRMMETLRSGHMNDIPPIDVLWYEAQNSGNNYFFSMGGCHRWEAYKRLNMPTIRAKLVRTTLKDLKIYFGSSLSELN